MLNLASAQYHRKFFGPFNGWKNHPHRFHPGDTIGIAKAINGMLKETIRWCFVLRFQNVQVILNLFFFEIKGTTFKMKGHMRKAAGIIGKGTLAFTGEFYGTL